MDETGSQGLEQFMIVCLAGSRKGSQGTAVETVFQRNNGGICHALFPECVLPCGFDGAFVSLSSRVAEKDLLHPGFFT